VAVEQSAALFTKKRKKMKTKLIKTAFQDMFDVFKEYTVKHNVPITDLLGPNKKFDFIRDKIEADDRLMPIFSKLEKEALRTGDMITDKQQDMLRGMAIKTFGKKQGKALIKFISEGLM